MTDWSDEWAAELAFISVHIIFFEFYFNNMDGRPFNLSICVIGSRRDRENLDWMFGNLTISSSLREENYS